MPPKKSPPKLRPSKNLYPAAVRSTSGWAVDYSPKFLRELKDRDPAAHDYLMRFLNAEYGNAPKPFYKKKKERRRCWRQHKVSERDAMNDAVQDPGIELASDAEQPSMVEHRLNAAIDNRHILKGLARCSTAAPKDYDAELRAIKKSVTSPKLAPPVMRRRPKR